MEGIRRFWRTMGGAVVLAALSAAAPWAAPLAAQDGFGFGEAEDAGGSGFGLGGTPAAVVIGGEVSAALTGFVEDFSDMGKVDYQYLSDLAAAKLNFSASGANADAVINLKLNPVFDGSSPAAIDEAYIRGYFGGLDLEAGLRKLTWGKADALGPLDVINPLDYSDFTSMNDTADMKIPRPLVHASYRLGSFTKLEGVFVPVFEGHHFAASGRWAQARMALLQAYITEETKIANTNLLEYAQAGLRFTTTLGPADIGAQYFYGSLFQPAFKIGITMLPDPPYGVPALTGIDYNRYHQIGIDYAQVIAGFNLRAEAAANITGDLSGDDGGVYNPAIAWSLGFDRDLLWGINLNAQGTGSVRLFDDQIGAAPLDIEADTDMTATRIILSLTKAFLRDTLEFRASGIWEIEERDFIIMPAITWTKDDITLSLSGGIFGGDQDGQFGQYRDNAFIRVGMAYTF